MGSVVRPVLAACAVAALIAGAAWWLHGGGATATNGDAKAPAAPPADTTADIGVTDNPPPPAPPPRHVVVRVLDADDAHALAGALVHLRVGGCEEPSFDSEIAADAEGRARFALAAGDEGLEVFVTAAGHVYASLEPEDVDAAAPEIVVSLARAGSVRGVVRDADGRPVDGVRVEADGHESWPECDAFTEGGGVYRIDGVEVGAEFSVSVAEHGRIASRAGLVVTKAGDVVTADLTLVAAATLRVRVLWPDGLPVAGATVEVQPSGAETETDESGRAEFEWLPGAKHHVVVRRPGFADAETDVELAVGETKDVDLRPVPNAVISGIVVDDAGFPVAGAAIAIDGQEAARTLADGKFRIASPDEEAHVLVVTHDGHCDTTVEGVTAPGEDLRIVVARRSKVRCRLVLPAGVPAPKRAAAWWDHRNAKSTVENGVLTIEVKPGAARLSFQVPGCVTVDRDVDAAPGEVTDLGDVVLDAAPKLTGRVVDEEGRPVDAFVFAKVGGVQVPLESTGADGAFDIDGLPPGAAEVRVEAKGFVNSTVRFALTPDAKPAVIVVRRGGGVKGKVVDEHGMPAPKAVYVSFMDASEPAHEDRQATAHIEDDGTFEIHLLPGKYKAHTTLDDGEGRAEAVVVDGQTIELTISINR